MQKVKNYMKFPYICTGIFVFIMLISIIWQSFGTSYIQTGIRKVVHEKSTQNTDKDKTNDEKKNDGENDDTNTDNIKDTGKNTPEKKRIALTFDDGPHPKYTPKLLDGLAERNVKATFFVIGESAANYPEILKRMSDEGHLIGNHTYSHVQLSCISKEKAISEINNTNNVIKEATGSFPTYIRPPYGSLPGSLKSETDLLPVLWNVDPRDWSVLNTNSVVNHVTKRVKDGSIILLHDIFDTSVDAALLIIDKLSQEGFEFVTIDELYN